MSNTQGMKPNNEDLEIYRKFITNSANDFLKNNYANVIGIGVGIKTKKGISTGELAIIVMVTKKVPKENLNAFDIIPDKVDGLQTDVIDAGGQFIAGGTRLEADIQTLKRRSRPVQGGYSVGHYKITAGTIATCVYNLLSSSGGIPSKYYILSNNHVLANSNNALIGDPILQPGPYDGGTYPNDVIAVLSRFVPLTFNPPVPLEQQNNYVDAAIAEGNIEYLDRSIYWCGVLRGWRRKSAVLPGTMVKKTGRTTNFTVGKILAVNAVIDVSYGTGTARLKDQIVTTAMSTGGDSGSLVMTLDNVAVGLLFAGSSNYTICNQIENVRSLLGIEIAEQVL